MMKSPAQTRQSFDFCTFRSSAGLMFNSELRTFGRPQADV